MNHEKQKLTLDIPYIRLRFRAKLVSDTRMPPAKTAGLRGGMGEMLLAQNCVTDRDCGKCRFSKVCVVQHTFYTPMEKAPPYMKGPESVGYLIECTDTRTEFRRGSHFEFYLILFGNSIAFFNIYLQAFCQLGMTGLGKHKARFQITEVYNTWNVPVVSGTEVDMSRYRISTVGDYVRDRKAELVRGEGPWGLRFITPLCMKHRQSFLQQFDGEALVRGAARRVQILNYYTGRAADLPEMAEYPEIVSQKVRKESVERYSGTRDSRMTLRGIAGTAVFGRMPEECLDWLIAGELVHMGKNTSFGFGKYILERKGVKGI